MDSPTLKLVPPGQAPGDAPRSRAILWGLATVIATAAILATVLGADAAREKINSRQRAQDGLLLALEVGNDAPEVQEILVDLRRNVARRPLDHRARVAYSSLLLGLSRRTSHARAAAFHARLAASMAPVTLPVQRSAAIVLARSGEREAAAEIVHWVFSYNPGAAAELLQEVEPFLFEDEIARALPDTPEACVAWAYQLRTTGRGDAADERLLRGQQRWPADPLLLELNATQAVLRGDDERLLELFPPDSDLADHPESARALPYQARARALRDDLAGARQDLARALELAGGNMTVRVLVAEASAAIGDSREARRLWNRALFDLRGGSDPLRGRVLVRLARLEEQNGQAAAALRLWRELLDLDPDHPEALSRVEALVGRTR